MKKILLIGSVIFLLIVLNVGFASKPGNLKASSIEWSGAISTNWFNPGNWKGGVVPSADDAVVIPSGLLRYPYLSANDNVIIQEFTIEDPGNAKFPLAGGKTIISGEFIVEGNLTIRSTGLVSVTSGGWLTIHGNLTILGSLVFESGSSLLTYGSITGNATIKRDIPNDLAWHFLSSPVDRQLICNGAFAPLEANFGTTPINTWDFFKWLADCPQPPTPAERWRNLRTSTQSVNYDDFGNPPEFEVTKGYLVAYGDNFQTTKSYTGVPNTGDKVCSFQDVETNCSWDLAGNPFPSAIDWDLVTDKSNLVTEYYYIWNEDKAGGPGYEFWKDDLHYSSSMVNGKIPPMQAFFVKVDPKGEKSIGLPNTARVHDNDNWLKEMKVQDYKVSVTLSNGRNYDKTFLMFEENNSSGKDRNDAEKLFSLNLGIPQVYTMVDQDEKCALNALPYFTERTTVPLGIVPPAEGDYSFTVEGFENLNSITGLSLEDLKLNYTHNLLQNPVYSFTSDGNEDASRFLLHFTGTISIDERNNDRFHIYSLENNLYISTQTGFPNARVIISNILGQEIYSGTLSDQTLNKIEMNANRGYYIVKIQNESAVQTSKIFIN